MPLEDKITNDLKTAMKAKDDLHLSCLRMLKTSMKNRQVEKGDPLADKEIISDISAESPEDLGRVMNIAMARMAGRAQGKEVNRIARRLLS